MKKITLVLSSSVLALSLSLTSSAVADKPTGQVNSQGKSNASAKPMPATSAASETKSNGNSSNNSNNSNNSSAASNNQGGSQPVTPGNNSSNANDKAKAQANGNSAVSKNETETATESGSFKRYIVRYNDNSLLSTEIKALTDSKVKVDRSISHVFKGAVAHLNDKQLANLKKNPNIAAIELDALLSISESQSTTSWGLDRIDQRTLPLDSTFAYQSTGSGAKIYIVDTGILATHSEFSGRVQSGFTAVLDGQGTTDCNGHGTHVSGIAAGTTTGVAKAATLIPVRVLDCAGSGYISDVISGLDWIATANVAGTPAVVNMSLGGGASSTLDTAINNLISRGITVVVAAGNSTVDACFSSPSRVPGALTVAASGSNDAFAGYSNFGSCVDVIAPGSNIYSSWYSSSTSYATLSGTSMATPYVAGYVASVLSLGYQTPSSIASLVASAATNGVVTGVAGSTPNLLLFTSGTLATPQTPTGTAPTAPADLLAVPQKRAASLSWTPATDGGSPITGQVLRIYATGKTVVLKNISATATALTVSNLNSNTTYTFTVTAVNAIGSGPESAKSNVIKPLK